MSVVSDTDVQPAPRVAVPPSAPARDSIVATAIQATAELAQIGMMAGARALRDALARLPRP